MYKRQTKARGIRLVLFTDIYASPLREHADLIVSSSVESVSPFDSLMPVMAQVEALVATPAVRMGVPLGKRLEDIDQLRNAFSSHLLGE